MVFSLLTLKLIAYDRSDNDGDLVTRDVVPNLRVTTYVDLFLAIIVVLRGYVAF